MWLKIRNELGFIQHHFDGAGFTLIEILIAISIVALVGGLVLANYTRYNKNQQLKQAALTLKSNLRLAQSKATTGQKPRLGCTELLGYQVTFSSSSSYSTQAVCTEGPSGEAISVSLPTGIQFSSIPNPITFGVLTRGIASDVTITLTNTAKNYAISLSRSGDINDLGFQ